MLILQHTVLLASNWLALLTQQRTRLSALYLMNLFSMDFSQYERVYECNVSIEAIPIPLIESINQRSRIRNISTALKIILQHLSAQHTFLLFNEPNDDDQRISSKVTFAAKEEGDPGFNPNATHVQIGSLYARITREQYVEMLSRSPRVVEELNNIPTPGPKAAKALKKWKWSKVFLARARNPKGIKNRRTGSKSPNRLGKVPLYQSALLSRASQSIRSGHVTSFRNHHLNGRWHYSNLCRRLFLILRSNLISRQKWRWDN